MRLFKAMLLLMSVASIVPMLLLGSLFVSDARKLLVRDAQQLAQERVQQLRLRAEALLDPQPLSDAGRFSLNQLLSQQRLGSEGLMYLVDAEGRLVAGNASLGAPGTLLSARPAVEHFLSATRAHAKTELRHAGHLGESDGGILAAYSVLPGSPWALVSEQPAAQAYEQVKRMQTRWLWGTAGAMLLAAALAAFFSRTLTRPLKGFIQGSLELASGKFGVQVSVPQKNELGELARTFNYMSQQLSAYGQETGRLYESLEKGYLETIVALANSIDSKDAYTRGHSQRVGDTAVEIGRELGLTHFELKHLQYGGILHDVGKIGIAETILCKQSRLTEAEMTVMREHPLMGDAIIQAVSFLGSVRACVRSHHERWDGTGYPDKLAGDKIPLLARIVACADTFDACTSTRPYQKAMPIEDALGVLQKLSGNQLDPQVVAALCRVVEKKGVRVEGQPRRPVKLAS